MLVLVNKVYDICDLTILCRGILEKKKKKKIDQQYQCSILHVALATCCNQYILYIMLLNLKVSIAYIYEAYHIKVEKVDFFVSFIFFTMYYISSRYNLILNLKFHLF